jgi:YfiH family protein
MRTPNPEYSEGMRESWHIDNTDNAVSFKIRHESFLLLHSISAHEDAVVKAYSPLFLHQIHSSDIIKIDHDSVRTGDGLLTQQTGCAVGIKIADCLPVFLFNATAVCIIHCGWRGIINGIAQRAAVLMNKYEYALGACIGSCCYEVGVDVARQFTIHYPSAIVTRDHRFFLDLKAAVRHDLGMDYEVASLDLCTYCHPQYFYSYRRGDRTLRNYACIMKTK